MEKKARRSLLQQRRISMTRDISNQSAQRGLQERLLVGVAGWGSDGSWVHRLKCGNGEKLERRREKGEE